MILLVGVIWLLFIVVGILFFMGASRKRWDRWAD